MFEKFKNKRGQLDARGVISLLLVLGLGLVVVGIIFAFGAKVNADVVDTMTAGSIEAKIGNNSLTGLANMSDQFGTIGLIGAAVVIIVLVLLIARVAGVRF